MKGEETKEPYNSSIVRRVMPSASETELLEATENLRRYVVAMWELYRPA